MMNYVLQSVIVSAILTAAYYLLFNNSKGFKTRRFILLVIPLLSLSIPALKYIDVFVRTMPVEPIYVDVLNTINIAAHTQGFANSLSPNLWEILMLFYCMVSALLMGRLLVQLRYISKLKQSSQKEGKVYYTSVAHQPFSFFKFIFINIHYKDSENLPLILNHEQLHINQAHSYDIVYYELLKIVFWFNPFLFILKQNLVQVHEFLVDDAMLKQETSFEKYYNTILNFSLFKPVTIGNNFNHSFTKIRFIMMTKNNNTQWLPVKALALFLVVAATGFAYANSNKTVQQVSKPVTEMYIDQDTTKVYNYQTIDVKPEFPGGEAALMDFLTKNTKYPEKARKKEIQGKVYVSFVIDKQGQVTDVMVNRGVHPLLDEEAKRVVTSFPKWSPGKHKGKPVSVTFRVPINFKLKPKTKAKQ